MFYLLFIIQIITFLFIVMWKGSFYLHMLQLSGYSNKNFNKWKKENKDMIISNKFILYLLLNLILIWISIITKEKNIKIINFKNFVIIQTIFYTLSSMLAVDFKRKKQKKPLVFTPRAKRLYITYIIVNIIELIILLFLYYIKIKLCPFTNYCSIEKNFFIIENLPIFLTLQLLIIGLVLPLNINIANFLIKPIEDNINRKFYIMAKNKILEFKKLYGLKVIGITGSFGKTSTKFIVDSILKVKFKSLKTPESYNTPMGISKIINNELNQETEIFIAEMGAKNKGDIKELVELVQPDIGIITEIGETHLDTFKTLENIISTKFELIKYMNSNGIAILNEDNIYIKKHSENYEICKLFYSIKNKNCFLYAYDINISENGTKFKVKLNPPEKLFKNKIFKLNLTEDYINKLESINFQTKLLGAHNILNILAGISVGILNELTPEEIYLGVKSIEPIPHRLQLINPGTGILIIDDAFNSNPVSSEIALDILNVFTERRKIIVTPGMIEMGPKQYENNFKFGQKIGKTVDIAIIVGNYNKDAIINGIKSTEFDNKNIFFVETLEDAQKILKKILKIGDIVLFENDLPDNYR